MGTASHQPIPKSAFLDRMDQDSKLRQFRKSLQAPYTVKVARDGWTHQSA